LKFLFCSSMYISRRALRLQFDPRLCPRETYLLCELQWGKSGRFWKHWVRNDSDDRSHAEKYFLEKIFEPRNYSFCDITLYLSWSPCWSCCNLIRDFLERNPNVNIDIRVARLYYVDDPRNRRGLRELHSLEGVTIDVMEAEGKVSHYIYCWETFIQGGVNYDFQPAKFQSAIQRTRSTLRDILDVSTL
ncbi:ABEC1 enzyme, partial [Melanocharis versteri]|nr:ABEC1 enzyme [Melanocharis versteri]